MYPVARRSLYGYDQAVNKSFKSSYIPDGVRTVKEFKDGINALFVPAGEKKKSTLETLTVPVLAIQLCVTN